MTEPSALLASVAQPGTVDLRRARAFLAASRHSARVKRLRRAMIAGAVLTVAGIVSYVVFDPFAPEVSGVSIDSASIDGTKVTMLKPKLSGYQKDGRPYAIEAARAVQDVKRPTIFELHELTARLTMPDRTVTHVTAVGGIYNSTAETMHLSGDARVHGDDGLDVVTTDALIEFSANRLTSAKPVSVSMPGKRITADTMRILDGGAQVTFDGHVHTEVQPESGRTVASASSAAP